MKVPTVSLAAILVMCVTSFSCGEEEQKQQSGSEAQAFTITMKGVT